MTIFKNRKNVNDEQQTIVFTTGGDVLVRGMYGNTLHPRIEKLLSNLGTESAETLEQIILASPKYRELIEVQRKAKIERLENELQGLKLPPSSTMGQP